MICLNVTDTPKRYSKRQPQRQRQDFPIEIRPEAFGLIFLALALLTALSLLSASRGSLTESWLHFLGGIMGWGMYLAPFLLAGVGIWMLRRFAVEDFGGEVGEADRPVPCYSCCSWPLSS